MYINHFFEDKVSQQRSHETIKLKANRIYWQHMKKDWRERLYDHFGIDDAHVRQNGDYNSSTTHRRHLQ